MSAEELSDSIIHMITRPETHLRQCCVCLRMDVASFEEARTDEQALKISCRLRSILEPEWLFGADVRSPC